MLWSNRLILRAIEESDLPLIASWRSNPEVYEYFYEFLPISIRQQKNWYEKQLSDASEINLVVAKNDKEPIGTVSIYHIDRRNRKAEWGRLIIGDPNERAGGVGGEIEALVLEYCFEHLNLHKLYCEVLVENERVISLHKKFGFKEEGIFKEHAFKNGHYVNVVSMAMLEDEYRIEKNTGRLAKVLERMRSKD